ncbi:GDSL esterase/lipase, partial [Cucurbita argyrosperma subsp. sororia]
MRPRIYLFGDSITEFSFADGGWGAALANHFSRRADVVVRGYSGYNTRWALKVLERVFPASEEHSGAGDPLALTVFFGANDACLPDRYGAFQHVPLDEYKQNLISIVSFLKVSSCSTRLLCSLSGTFSIDLAKISFRLVIGLDNLMPSLLYYFDGLHLSRNGNTIVFEEVVQKLKEEGLSPEMLPADLPLLSEMDYNDPLKAFEELR